MAKRLLSGLQMINVLRFAGGLFLLGLASLTRLPATTHLLWRGSVAATEWGYWLALVALLMLLPARAATRTQAALGRLGAFMSFVAIGLFVMPVVSATELNKTLPRAMEAHFGPAQRQRHKFAEQARAEPLILPQLLNPVKPPAVRYEERVFAAHDGQSLTLAVYRPAYVHGAVPAILVIHGGTWRDGDRGEFAPFNAYLASRDYVVAAMDYRLAPQWRFPAARDDVLSALAYLKVYSSDLGIDPTQLALLGRSGGGQLALLAAYTAQDPAVRGVISLYGQSDLRFEYEHPAPRGVRDTRGALEAYLGGAPGTNADDSYYTASPVNFVSASSPPSLLVHGERDPIVSPDQTSRLEARLQQSGVKNLFVRLPWATHSCDMSFGGPCGQIVNYAVERFLDSVMKAPAQPSTPRTAPSRKVERNTKSAERSERSKKVSE